MDTVANEIGIIGKGAYTVSDARRLTGVPESRIRRWLMGRSRLYRGDVVHDAPLWTPVLPLIEDGLYLTFRDLIELRMVDRFRQQKISMPYLRKLVAAARELAGDTHPFSTSRFRTDGRRFYLEMLSKTREPRLMEVLSGQHVFHSIISVGLKDIDFDAGVASAWRPEAGQGEVVIDPARAFGKPILRRSGVPTSVVRNQAEAGRTAQQIANDFEIDGRAVRAALAFEGRQAA